MARPKNTPEKIERMRNSMMDAVISLLDHVSPEKVSIRMIADKVGVSHMVFYTYFKDRDEIMVRLPLGERRMYIFPVLVDSSNIKERSIRMAFKALLINCPSLSLPYVASNKG